MHEMECTVAHDGRFMKATEYKFELTRIGVAVPDGIDPGDVGGIIERVYFNRISIQVKAPGRDRSQFRTQAEQRDQVLCFYFLYRTVHRCYPYQFQFPISMKRQK